MLFSCRPEYAPPPSPAVLSPGDATSDRSAAIAEAEAFVRAQGYTDTASTALGNEIVREGIEGTMDDRRNTLEPKALRASKIDGNGNWDVIFKYRDPKFSERGRMLRLRRGTRPSFVHQDLLLDVALKTSGP
jgi:hypothetical protein